MSKEELLERLVKLHFAVVDIEGRCNEIMEVCDELGDGINDLMKDLMKESDEE